MNIDIYQVDAFASEVFKGNPAAVCPLNEWLPDEVLLSIAEENNLSETAFFVGSEGEYELRWFTPQAEVDLCGHATLASAHVIFKHLRYSDHQIQFNTRSGILIVKQTSNGYQMDFPASMPELIAAPDNLIAGLRTEPVEVLASYDYVIVLKDEQAVIDLAPDLGLFSTLDKRGVLVTAPGDDVDFVSRCFFPKLAVNEDPVTGSAHCELTPYWANELERSTLLAKQLSRRTGLVSCELKDDRVLLSGYATDYMKGVISI